VSAGLALPAGLALAELAELAASPPHAARERVMTMAQVDEIFIFRSSRSLGLERWRPLRCALGGVPLKVHRSVEFDDRREEGR
jgi:hypothetical protein